MSHTKEVEAESTAFIVATLLGLDTSDYSFEYIAGWNGKDNLKVNMYGATLRMPTLKNGTYKFALKPNKNFTINTAKLQQTYGNTARNVNIKNAKKVKITKDAYFMFMMKYKNMDIVNVCFQG